MTSSTYPWWRKALLILAVALICGAAVYLGSLRTGAQSAARHDDVPMVSADAVRQEYERRTQQWQTEARQLTRVQSELMQLRYEQMTPDSLLLHGSHEEQANLATILGLSSAAPPLETVFELRRAGSHSVVRMVKGGLPVSYDEVVADVALALGAREPLPRGSRVELERAAIRTALEKLVSKASPEGRDNLIAEIAQAQGVPTSVLVTTSGTIVVANLAGFGLYLGASTALGAVTGTLGLTLPFAVYAGMSSAIAVAIGPVGWAALAAGAIYKLGQPDYSKTIPGVLAIATLRSRLIAERDARLVSFAHRWTLLEKRAERLGIVRTFLVDIERSPDRLVPHSTVPW